MSNGPRNSDFSSLHSVGRIARLALVFGFAVAACGSTQEHATHTNLVMSVTASALAHHVTATRDTLGRIARVAKHHEALAAQRASESLKIAHSPRIALP